MLYLGTCTGPYVWNSDLLLGIPTPNPAGGAPGWPSWGYSDVPMGTSRYTGLLAEVVEDDEDKEDGGGEDLDPEPFVDSVLGLDAGFSPCLCCSSASSCCCSWAWRAARIRAISSRTDSSDAMDRDVDRRLSW